MFTYLNIVSKTFTMVCAHLCTVVNIHHYCYYYYYHSSAVLPFNKTEALATWCIQM